MRRRERGVPSNRRKESVKSYTVNSPFAPGRLVFGAGESAHLAEMMPRDAKKTLLVCGTHAQANGTAREIMLAIEKSARTCKIHADAIPPEPPLESVDAIISELRSGGFDSVAAVGGGSVIDSAKTAAFIAPFNASCRDYFSGGVPVPAGHGLFFAALPTTAGTGSECTRNAVLTDTATMIKKSIRSEFMLPRLSIVDPVLTLTCPPRLTASSGLDAFVQAAESYANPNGSTVTRLLAAKALQKIFFNLKRAYTDGTDIDARSEVAEGSMLAGLSFAQCGLGAVHGIAHPAGSLLHVPHGMACAILMEHVSRFNAETDADVYAELAEIIKCRDFADECRKLNSSLGIPSTFRDYGLSEKHFEFIIKNSRSGSMKANPRPMNDADIEKILEKVM